MNLKSSGWEFDGVSGDAKNIVLYVRKLERCRVEIMEQIDKSLGVVVWSCWSKLIYYLSLVFGPKPKCYLSLVFGL